MTVKTYDPAKVSVIFNGVPLHGFADGTFVRIERDEDMFTKVTGADGETSRAKSNNRGGFAAVILQQTSESNDHLAAFAEADEINNAGHGPLLVKDLNGTTLAFASSAWIKKKPNAEFGKEITDREWVIDCADLKYVPGGSL